MKRTSLSVIVGLLLIGFSSQAAAHSLWINLNESYTHPPGHAIVSLGWGHVIPMDDLLVSKAGSLQLATFDLIDPDMNRTGLTLPSTKAEEIIEAQSGMTVQAGDLGIRKLALTKETKPGTWQTVATSKENFFTKYIDNKGRQRMAQTTMDQITNVKQVIFSVKLMPLTDLSKVHAGDLVGFDVSFMGKPLSVKGDKIEYMTATSNTFGGPDNFSLFSYLQNGKAQFRMPAAGQWVVNVYVKQEVTKDGLLKKLVGKCTAVWYAGTISFNVKP
jgi:uncharacterized GH25 family protein